MRRLVWALVLSLVVALPVGAQETRGNIAGTVRDNAGVIPGATVTIVSTDTGSKQELITNSSGYFEAPLMQPGTYEISVEMTGFKRTHAAGRRPRRGAADEHSVRARSRRDIREHHRDR